MEAPSKNEFEEGKQSNLISRRLWTSKDDRILEKAIAIHGTNWKEVSKMLKLRNPSQCAQRWKRIKPETHRSRYAWTAEEDKQLLELVQMYQRNWRLIAQVMKRRTGKQVRERYINKLNPDICQDPFNSDEDKIILEWYQRIGPKWTEISKQLQGRPENMIKNRFYSSIRKQQGQVKIQQEQKECPSQEKEIEYTDFKKPVGIYKKIKSIKFKPTRPLTRNAAKQEQKQQKQQKQQQQQKQQNQQQEQKQINKKEPNQKFEEQKEEKQQQIIIKVEEDVLEQRERSRRVFEHFQRQYQIYKRFLEVNSPLKIQPFMSKNTDLNIIQCQIQEHINLARNESFYLPTQLSYGNLWNNLIKQSK